jgi:hypothetical protein
MKTEKKEGNQVEKGKKERTTKGNSNLHDLSPLFIVNLLVS